MIRFFLGLCLVGILMSGAVLGSVLSRRVLIIYDPANIEDLHQVPAHQHLELPLNHLGLQVEYHSIAEPLPSRESLAGFFAVITWFQGSHVVKNTDSYCEWMQENLRQGIKWIVLDWPGFAASQGFSGVCSQLLEDFGVSYGGDFTDDPLVLKVTEKDSAMVEFERPLEFISKVNYLKIRRTDPEGKTFLKIRRLDLDDSDSDLVFTTRHGGYAHEGYVLLEQRDLKKYSWRLNPFLFFEKALAIEGGPRPDVTTYNGRRLFMTHIDGDGVFNVSDLDRKSYSGEIILNEIIKKYDDTPHSVSLITGYFDMPEYQGEREKALYRNIFAQANVEAAVHAHSHPLVWQKGTFAVEVPGYQFDQEYEITGSFRRMEDMLRELGLAKRTQAYFWSGDCAPDETQLDIARKLGVPSINGGNSRFDSVYDSHANLYPIGLNRKGRQQIYAPFPNENVFTNLWKGPFYGYRTVAESFRNTESPRRLKPIDIYYHFYSGEKLAGLNVLRGLFDEFLNDNVFPVPLSKYARIAEGFFSARIEKLSGNAYRITENGELRTVRFDQSDVVVDLNQSKGVLGFNRHEASLYVHLDESPVHEIFLAQSSDNVIHLESANVRVEAFKREANKIEFSQTGWRRRREVILAGFMARQKLFMIEEGGEGKTEYQADAQGRLKLQLSAKEMHESPRKVTLELLAD